MAKMQSEGAEPGTIREGEAKRCVVRGTLLGGQRPFHSKGEIGLKE